jgi:hypothetical protein
LQQSRAAFAAVDERRQRRQPSKISSTDWTTVDETDRDLLTMTRFLGIEIRLAIAGTRHLRKVPGGRMRGAVWKEITR